MTQAPFQFTGNHPLRGLPSRPAPAAPMPTHMPTPLALPRRIEPRRQATPVIRPVEIDGVGILARVVEISAQHSIDLADLVRAVREPETTFPAQDGSSTVHLRDAVAAIVSDSTGDIIAVSSRERALRMRSIPRTGAIKKAKGTGMGNRFPQDVRDLLDRLAAHGFEVDPHRRHYVLTHPHVPGQSVTAPKTPSDHHSIPNTVLAIRHAFGIDIRDTPRLRAVPDETVRATG